MRKSELSMPRDDEYSNLLLRNSALLAQISDLEASLADASLPSPAECGESSFTASNMRDGSPLCDDAALQSEIEALNREISLVKRALLRCARLPCDELLSPTALRWVPAALSLGVDEIAKSLFSRKPSAEREEAEEVQAEAQKASFSFADVRWASSCRSVDPDSRPQPAKAPSQAADETKMALDREAAAVADLREVLAESCRLNAVRELEAEASARHASMMLAAELRAICRTQALLTLAGSDMH